MTTKTIRLKVTEERAEEFLTLDDLIAIGELRKAESIGESNLKEIREILGKFVVNGTGDYLESDEGITLIGKMTTPTIEKTIEKFLEETAELAAPKATEGNSKKVSNSDQESSPPQSGLES